MERSTDTKLKPIQGLLSESKTDVLALRQQLHRTEDTVDLKLSEAAGAAKAQLEAQAGSWQTNLDAAGAAQTSLVEKLRDKLLAEVATLSRQLQSATAEQAKLNGSQTAAVRALEAAGGKLEQALGEHAAHHGGQLANAVDEHKQQLATVHGASERQVKELAAEVDRKHTALL